uniref:Uncharacterized protein n=1 Tax=Arundo donax TaxID=35708 RepID=A0A0A9H675_ARUDO
MSGCSISLNNSIASSILPVSHNPSISTA